MKNLFFCITLCSIIISCSKDEDVQNYDVPDISTQKVYSEFDISNAPNGRFDFGWTDGSRSINSDNGVINYIAYGYQLTYIPSAPFTTIASPIVSSMAKSFKMPLLVAGDSVFQTKIYSGIPMQLGRYCSNGIAPLIPKTSLIFSKPWAFLKYSFKQKLVY